MTANPRYDELTDAYNEAKQSWGTWLNKANECLRVYLGDQWNAEEKKHLAQYKRAGYIFNRIKRIVKIVAGYERKNRLSLKIGGFGNEDDPAANQLTSVVMRTMNQNGYHTLSECFKWGSLVTGMNLLWLLRDPYGDIGFDRSPHDEFLLDPGFTRRDLSNCNYILRGKWITGRELVSIFGGELTEQEVLNLYPDQATTSRWNIGKMSGRVSNSNRKGLNMVHLVEEKWGYSSRQKMVTIDPKTGMEMEVPYDQPEYLTALSAAGAPLNWTNGPTVEFDIFVDGQYVRTIQKPYGLDQYPCVMVGGEFCPEQPDYSLRLQSFIQCVIDAQRADNRRFNQLLDLNEVAIHQMIIARMKDLVDPEGLASGANRKTLFLKGDADPNSSVVVKSGGDIPAGLFAVQELLDRQITEIPAINEELFGTEENDIAGVLSKLRQGGALTALQEEFDNLRMAKSELGRKIVMMVQGSYPKQKIRRILNEDPAPDFYKTDLVRYDCIPQEGVLTDSQREMFFLELKTMFETGLYPIPPSLVLKNMPSADKKQILQTVQQNEQQQAQQAQLAQRIAAIEAELKNAKLKTEIAQADELHAQAAENRASAKLDQARAVAEIQNLQRYGQPKPPKPADSKTKKKGR